MIFIKFVLERFCVISLLYSCVKSNQNIPISDSLTMGHKYVSSIQDVPYHVLVVYGNLYCSGTLIRSKIVITSGSCITVGPKEKIFVKVGSNTITGVGQVISVVETKIHEYFQHYSITDNDIALLFLKENVIFEHGVKKAIIANPKTSIGPGSIIEVSGWGSQSQQQNHAYQLLATEMIVLKRNDCLKTFYGKITHSNFCARFDPSRRLVDIGGPATHKKELVGIASYGLWTELGPSVTIFTNVSYFYRWIMLNTQRFLENNCIPDTSHNTSQALVHVIHDDDYDYSEEYNTP